MFEKPDGTMVRVEGGSLRSSSLVERASAESGFKAGGKRNKGGRRLEIPTGDLRLGTLFRATPGRSRL